MIIIEKENLEEFKTTVAAMSLQVETFSSGGHRHLFAQSASGNVIVRYRMKMRTPPTEENIDFEDNIKPGALKW